MDQEITVDTCNDLLTTGSARLSSLRKLGNCGNAICEHATKELPAHNNVRQVLHTTCSCNKDIIFTAVSLPMAQALVWLTRLLQGPGNELLQAAQAAG